MQPAYQISQTARGWYDITQQRRGLTSMQDLSEVFRSLEGIPGISVYPSKVSVPWTALAAPAVQEAFTVHGITLQPPSSTAPVQLWAPRRSLFPHQEGGAEWLFHARSGLLADEMGLGKTTTSIVATETLCAGSKRPRLIIAPKFTRASWLRELELLGAASPEEICVLEGRDSRAECWREDAKWYFIHYDIAQAWANRFLRVKPLCAIVDEAHFVKSATAQRSKGTAAAVLPIPHRIVLTGTPLANKPGDLWHLLTLVGGAHTWGSYFAFRQRYLGAYYDGNHWVDGELTHQDELRARLESCYLRRDIRSAGVQLPSLTRTPIEVDMTQEERDVERSLLLGYEREEILNAVLQGRAGKQVLSLLAKLRAHTSKAKLKETTCHVKSALEQGEAVVVFTHERAIAKKLAKQLGTDFCVTGDMDQDARDRVVQDWTAQGGALVATYGSLGVGVTLTRARMLYLHDLDWVPATVLQAEKRIYRIGQQHACQVFWVVAKESIDTVFARVLEIKARHLASITSASEAEEAFQEVALDDIAKRSFERDVSDYLDRWLKASGA